MVDCLLCRYAKDPDKCFGRWREHIATPEQTEMMDVKKEQNFFEGRVTEYQKSSALAEVADDEL